MLSNVADKVKLVMCKGKHQLNAGNYLWDLRRNDLYVVLSTPENIYFVWLLASEKIDHANHF